MISYHLVRPCDVILTSLRNYRFFNESKSVDQCITSINDFYDTKNQITFSYLLDILLDNTLLLDAAETPVSFSVPVST